MLLGIRSFVTALAKQKTGVLSGKPVESNILDTWVPPSSMSRFFSFDFLKRSVANRYR